MITMYKNVLMNLQTLETMITMHKLLICGLPNVSNEINDVQKRTDGSTNTRIDDKDAIKQTLEMRITMYKNVLMN